MILRGAALFAVFFVVLASMYAAFPAFYDADSYYHLAVARLYVAEGFVNSLTWARFSVLADRFGDKDFLFHVFLMPFVACLDANVGGVIALAVLGALVATIIGWLAAEAVGGSGIVVPALLFATATDFSLRMIRLRPELLALALLLLVIPLAAKGRSVALAIVSAAYALAYTGFHVVLALMLIFLLYRRATSGRWSWGLLAWPAAGITAGVCLHPGFPSNVRIWAIQNVTFFVQNPSLDFGPEILPRTTRDALVLNLGWWLALALLWRTRVGTPPVTTLTAPFLALSALAFGILYALMARFVIYAVPLITLAFLFSMRRPSGSSLPRVRLVGTYTVPLAAGLVVTIVCGIGTTWLGSRRVVEQAGRVFQRGTRADFQSFSDALPVGAKVFAPWAATEEFVFWAPQGRYLVVLDPIFMIARDPGLYRAYVEVLEAREPDIPLVAKVRFDSDFFADDGQYPIARARLAQDPRAEIVHDGASYLYRLMEGRNGDFMLDWKIVPQSAPGLPSLDVLAGSDLEPYPRSESNTGRAVEGFVDGSRVATGCVMLARIEHASGREVLTLEVAPYGAAELYVDGEMRVGIPPRSAFLGRGVFVPIELSAGDHSMAIRTCPYEGHAGFYALRRATAGPG